jgi:hypothetical protein
MLSSRAPDLILREAYQLKKNGCSTAEKLIKNGDFFVNKRIQQI